MRVFVIGATGNVGGRLVERLAADPQVEQVVGLSRRRPESMPARVEWRPLDTGRPVPAETFRGADAVVHLAWLFQPTRRPEVTWEANAVGTSRVLEAVAEAKVPVLVHASSVGAYSPCPSQHLVDESWPTHGVPTAAYSREKAYVERLLDIFERDHPGVRVARMRPAFTFREESAVQQRRLFGGPFAPARLFRKVRLPVLPDPGGLRFQTVHTDDVAQGYHLALTRDVRGAFNLAADPVLDLPAMGRLLGVPVRQVPRGAARSVAAAAWLAHLVPASPGLFDLLVNAPMMDTTRAREVLGWRPEHDAVGAVQAFLAGIESNRGAPTPPLDPRTSGPLRRHEAATGVGERD
jgi:nucleoside-diphosphate-sugar epimerase